MAKPTRERVRLGAARLAGPVLFLLISGCAREFSFTNRTDAPVVVSVAAADRDGAVTPLTAAVVDPGGRLELAINAAGPAAVSVWAGLLRQGPPAAALEVPAGGASFELRPAPGGIDVARQR